MHKDGADCSCCPPVCLQRENKCLKYLSTWLMDLAKLLVVPYLACRVSVLFTLLSLNPKVKYFTPGLRLVHIS